MRLITLNANGIRSAIKKDLEAWIVSQQADFLCIQELKAQQADFADNIIKLAGLHGYFHCAEKKGYSGVAIYSRQAADQVIYGFGNEEFDAEGRVIEARFGNLSVISLYLPSGSSSEERQQAKFRFMSVFFEYMQQLQQSGRQILIAGDWNIAHQKIDLKNWQGNQNNSGFLPEERQWFSQVLENWCDVYRQLYPQAEGTAYTWWSNRGQAWANNVGWRIDYLLANPSLAGFAKSAAVYKEQRFSDHAPIVFDFTPELWDKINS